MKIESQILKVANDYTNRGYEVIINPKTSEIPLFIKNYQPDIVAKSKEDNVIIEFKNRADLSDIERFRDVIDIISKKENWRFELIVPQRLIQFEKEKSFIEYSFKEIKKNIIEIERLMLQKFYQPAFLLCWSNFESISRNILLEDKKDLKNKSSLSLLKTLYSLGHLSKKDYENLESLFHLRNQVVHGYKSKKIGYIVVKRFLRIIKKLYSEKLKAI